VCCAALPQVRVLVPDAKGGRIEVAVLGRGQFVGERSVINDKLRSADCVAQGRVQVRLVWCVLNEGVRWC
jgi:CRP-like cAMP-binding protein